MKKLIISLLFAMFAFQGIAQNEIKHVLHQIETNSTLLSALREQIEAQKLNNLTGIYLPNPEVEFNYLRGNPSALGNRTDINLTQSFDFPTAYGFRDKIANLENTNIDLMYKSERISLLLRAKQICIELAYYNAMAMEYSKRLTNAQRISDTYQTRLDRGDANILENNKAQLNLKAVRNALNRIEIEQASLRSELRAMNGGKEINFAATGISNNPLPPNFEDWYLMAETKSPVLLYVRGEIEISQKQISLNRALGLPRFSAGYMSEKVAGQQFQGITIGLSIPLWENKNKVKQARAQVQAAETALEDKKTQFYNRLQKLYSRSLGLQAIAAEYREALMLYNNETLLKRALDSGEIPLLTYLLEIEYYYDAMNKLLEAEKDFNLSLAELSSIEL